MKKLLTLVLLMVTFFFAKAQCDTVQSLSATLHSPDWYNVQLNWNEPASLQSLTWCTGVYNDGIGTGEAADFTAAHRYATTDLTSVNGQTMTAVSFYPLTTACTYSIRVWTGGSALNPGTMVVDMQLDNNDLSMNAWNTIMLSTPVTIDATQELWIGIRCNTTGGYPAAYDGDANAEVPGKGNMMYFSGAWDTLTNLGSGLNGNWLIKGLFSVPTYDVYLNSELLAGNVSALNYLDLVPGEGHYTYEVALNGCTEKVSVEVDMPVDPCEGVTIIPPYLGTFDTTDPYVGCWRPLDVNGDGSTFEPRTDYGNAAYYYNSSNAANDYMVSPEIVLTGNEALSFDYYCDYAVYPEKLSVYIWGENDTTELMPTTTVTNETALNQVISLTAFTGNYRIAFKCESAADMDVLFIDNVQINAACDMAPTDFVVTSVNDATVDFSWTAVANAQYQIQYKLASDTAWTVAATDLTTNTYTFNGEESTAYEFRLYQKCEATDGYTQFVSATCLTNPLVGAFAHAVAPDSYLYNFDVNDPETVTPVIEIPDVYAGEYYAGDYYYANAAGEFWKMNMNTFVTTQLGTWNSILRDMAYDYTTNTMYGVGDSLFTIDLATGARTGIDTLATKFMTLACDLQGNLYAVELTTGDFYSLDKTTAAYSLIGATGVATSYIQSMGFDHNSEILYWTHYGSTGDFYTIDPSTGAATYVGDFYNNNEVGAFFTAYTYNPEQAAAPALDVVPNEDFEMEATVTVVAPTVNIGGGVLAAIDSIVVTRNDEVINVIAPATPGDTFVFVDNTDLACGQYAYKAYAVTEEAIGLIAMQTVEIGNMCDIYFNMTDEYGDGWAEAMIEVYVDGEYKTSVTLTGGAEGQKTVRVCDGAMIELHWVKDTYYEGEYDYEIGFTVEDAYQQFVYFACATGDAMNYADGAVLGSFTHSCAAPSCFKPTDLQVSNIEDVTAVLSWTDTLNTTWVVEFGPKGFEQGTGTIDTVNTTSYTFSGLTPNTEYDVYVYADCGAEDGISITSQVAFTTDICPAADKCDITINMTDAYGDGWVESGWFGLTGAGYLEVASDGVVLGQVYLEDGTSGTEIISACVNSTITITWKIEGELAYADEIGFTIIQGQGYQVASVTDGSTLTNGQVVATFEQRCDVGVEENAVVEQQVNIYPNPTRDILNVQAENFRQVEVLNFLGQVVYSANVTSSQFQINTSNLNAGVYFVRLSGDNVVTKKFVKE